MKHIAFLYHYPQWRDFELKSLWIAVLILSLVSSGLEAQSGTSSGNSQTSAGAKAETRTDARSSDDGRMKLPNGLVLDAELTRSIDTGKALKDDRVSAAITRELFDGAFRIPKGSKLIGHIVQVQAFTKANSKSTLALAFDKMILKDGQEIAFHGKIRSCLSWKTLPQLRIYESQIEPLIRPSDHIETCGYPMQDDSVFFSNQHNVKLQGGDRVKVEVVQNANPAN